MSTEQITALKLEIAKAKDAVDRAYDTAVKMEQSDWWGTPGLSMTYGRHAKAARTRLSKRTRTLERLERRLAELTKGVA